MHLSHAQIFMINLFSSLIQVCCCKSCPVMTQQPSQSTTGTWPRLYLEIEKRLAGIKQQES